MLKLKSNIQFEIWTFCTCKRNLRARNKIKRVRNFLRKTLNLINFPRNMTQSLNAPRETQVFFMFSLVNHCVIVLETVLGLWLNFYDFSLYVSIKKVLVKYRLFFESHYEVMCSYQIINISTSNRLNFFFLFCACKQSKLGSKWI